MSKQTAQDSLTVIGQTAAGWGAGVTTVTPIVGQLLVAAGVSSAVPGIGWIVAGGTAAIAGTIALIGAIRRGEKRKKEAVAEAAAAGLPDPDKVPAFVVQALKQGPVWRAKQSAKLIPSLQKAKQKGKLDSKASQKDLAKMKILAILDLHERATQQGNEPPAAPVASLEKEYGTEGPDRKVVLGGLLGGGLLLLWGLR